MKEIKTVDAVGHVLCHDITQIIKDVSKGPVFRKGHIIREEDIPVLLSVGKDHIYVWENDATMMHEDDAAEVLCAISKGENIRRGEAKEGKIELRAECDGRAMGTSRCTGATSLPGRASFLSLSKRKRWRQ